MRNLTLLSAVLATTVSAVTLEVDAQHHGGPHGDHHEAGFGIDLTLDDFFGDFFESLETPTTYTTSSALLNTHTSSDINFLNDYLYDDY